MNAPSPADCFPQSYADARAAFLRACADAGAEITSHRHPLSAPDGAPLFLDVARVGAPDARRVLFLMSGTHGVEGFCGSGIQTFLLRDGLLDRLPAGVALVIVHAVNPWGFAWLRRVNEDNVDINRNFLNHRAPYPQNPDYDRLYDALNPERLDDAAVAALREAVRCFEQEHGWEAVYRSLSGGQYRHPRGLQYGGRAPVWSNRVLRAVWTRHVEDAELAACVDLHSGLGPCGIGLLLQTAPAVSTAARLAHAWWPDVIRSEPAQGSDAALASGLMGPAFVTAHPQAAAVGLVLEFGTRDINEVMLAMHADNWLHHYGVRDSETGRAIARRMQDAFYMQDDVWKEQVCRRAREVVDHAFAGMAAFVPEPASGDGAPVRPARPDDLDILVAFEQAMARETESLELDSDTVRTGVAELLTDPTRGRVFLVECNGGPVATLTLTLEWSDWRNAFFWWIQSVYVSPAHRRHGHYRRLHEHVRALAARDPSVCGLRLYVEHENHTAQETYRALGMHETYYRLFEQPIQSEA
jgi:ribosomal protein S18 acetylase RimI-like enzyme